MGLEQILKKIKSESEAEKEKIRNEIESERKKILNDASEKAKIIASRILEKGRAEINLEKSKIIANAKISAKDKIDKVKAMWVENAFEEAKREILSLPDNKKSEILKKLCDIEDKENFDVYVDEKYKNLINNAKVENIGDFGVILRSKDGIIKINNSLNEKIRSLKQNMSSKVAEILFKE